MIEELFYEAVYRELESPERRNEIHVSDLIYDCLRRAYYNKKFGARFSIDSAVRMWIGKLLHKTPLTKHSELKLEWKGVVGSIDEYNEETKTVFDKKTTRKIPSYPYSNHVKQLSFYKLLLETNGYPVEDGYVLYLNVGDPVEVKALKVRFLGVEEVLTEMARKRNSLQIALATDSPPPRVTGWTCRYCDHNKKCFSSF